jgi:selenocysteine lyase/cysteine desulfurase
MIIPCQRALFDIPENVCYLNAAYMTPLTKQQVMLGDETLQKNANPWTYSEVDFFTIVEDVRALSAEILGVNSDDMAIVPSASYGLAVAGKNMPLQKGEVILMMEGQFPSNVYEWMERARECGAELVFVDTSDNHDWSNAILEAIEQYGNRIAFAALANVHWASGAKLDLEEISKALKLYDAGLVLDITQSVGAVPIDLAKIDPDFVVCASYKWMVGPYGLGVLYAAPRHHRGKAIEQNWINRTGSEDFAGLVNYQSDFQNGARRFDFGERASFILMPIFKEGLRQLLDWGVENISETLGALNARIADCAENVGLSPINQKYRGNHMLGINLGNRADEYATKLKSENIYVSIRGGMLRVAPHLWVSDQDLERFENVIKSI